MSRMEARAWSLKSRRRVSSSLLGMWGHFLSEGVLDCCSSMQRSLIVVWLLVGLLTLGLMQRFLREPRVICFVSSVAGLLGSSGPSGGRPAGRWTRWSSPTNWESWEWVLEQKKIFSSSSVSSSGLRSSSVGTIIPSFSSSFVVSAEY